jgi:thiamine pyrophosphokinase
MESMNSTLHLQDLKARFPSAPQREKELFVIGNGNLNIEELIHLVDRINLSAGILLVDGGGNHFCRFFESCQQRKIELKALPLCLLGDLDSITEESQKKLTTWFPNMEVIRFQRDKDYTDFEAALQLIRIDWVARVVVLGALGNRIDHTLGNILYLFRERLEGKVCLLTTHQELLCVIGAKSPLKIALLPDQGLSLFPLDGKPKELLVSPTKAFDDSYNLFFGAHQEVELQFKEGAALGIVHQSKVPQTHLEPGMHIYEFNAPGNLLKDLQIVYECIKRPGDIIIDSPQFRIEGISRDKPFSAAVEIGQTISLIPLAGIVRGINTAGLKWALNSQWLDIDFLGISNEAISTKVNVTVDEGVLLCVINK